MSDQVTFLINQIELMNKTLRQKEIKHEQALLSQRILLQEKHSQFFHEEMGKVRHRCQHENEQLIKDLATQKENFRRCEAENNIKQQNLKAENKKVHEIMRRCQQEKDQLKLELTSQQEHFKRCEEENLIEQQKLKDDNQQVHEIMRRCQQEKDHLKLELDFQKEQSEKWKNMMEQEKLTAENRKDQQSRISLKPRDPRREFYKATFQQSDRPEHEEHNTEGASTYDKTVITTVQHENEQSQKENFRRSEEENNIELHKLKAENHKVHEITCRCQQENDQLKLDLESQKEQSENCKNKNRMEQEKLTVEIRKLKTRVKELEWEFSLASPDGMGCTSLQKKLDTVSKAVDRKYDQLQDMESINRSLMVELQTLHWIEGVRKEQTQKSDQVQDMVLLYQSLMVALLMTRNELKGVLKKLREQSDQLRDMESLNQRLLIDLRGMESYNQSLMVKWQMACHELEGVRKEQTEKSDQLQDMVLLYQSLMVALLMTHNELDGVLKKMHKQSDQMRDVESLNQSFMIESHDMESYNQSLMVECQMTRHELEGLCNELIGVQSRLSEQEKESIALKKDLEQTNEDMQHILSINKALVAKERISTDELQNARKLLLTGSSDFLTQRTAIRIKRMGELDPKPFQEAFLERVSGEESSVKAAELCSLWVDNVQDFHWQPFKRVKIDGEFGAKEVEVVDADDKKLSELRNVWGQHVYEAVSTALSELNSYNPSGRYPVPELWNSKECRKCDLSEVIEYLLKQLTSLKSLKRKR